MVDFSKHMKKVVIAMDTRIGRIHIGQCKHEPVMRGENAIVLSTGAMVVCTDCFCNIQDGKNGVTVRRL